jgi:hypothetical protein
MSAAVESVKQTACGVSSTSLPRRLRMRLGFRLIEQQLLRAVIFFWGHGKLGAVLGSRVLAELLNSRAEELEGVSTTG